MPAVSKSRAALLLLILLGVLTGVVLLNNTPVVAASCGGVQTSIIDCRSANDATGSPVVAVLAVAIQILTALIGIVAIGAFIYAGVMYSAAGGVASQVAKAKEIMTNTVTGLVVFAGMGLLVTYLLPGGLFSGSAGLGASDAEDIALGGGAGAGSSSIASGRSSRSPADVDMAAAANFVVATYNIRASDQTPWDSTRANSILAYLKTVDILGIQEGREQSIKWLTPKMQSAGYSRTKNQWARQVFWNTSLFNLIKQGERQTLSAGKDLVWVKLKDKKSGKQFYFSTIHLTVDKPSTRTAELRVALAYMNSAMTDAPIIFVGDMNSEIGSSQDKQIQNAGFKDSYSIARTKKNTKYKTTLSNFTGRLTGKIDVNSDHQIDHIYIKGNLIVQRIEVKNQRGSDHLPVEAAISIPTGS